MDDSTLTVVYTRVVTGTAVVFVSVVGCVDVTTGNDVCDTGRAVLVVLMFQMMCLLPLLRWLLL